MSSIRFGGSAIIALLGLALVACSGGDETAQVAAPTAVVQATAASPAAASTGLPLRPPPIVDTPAPTPLPPSPEPTQPPDCAAGITAELRNIDPRVDWTIYCPTHLPEGYAKKLIGGPNPLEIHIINPATGSRIFFVQGVGMGLSSATSLVREEGELVGPVPYGDLEGKLFHSLPGAEHGPFVAVIAFPEGEEAGPIQYIEAHGPSETEITAIAASMRRLDAIP